MWLWIKALHIIAMVAWFAGLFYLPRLFVYHAEARDNISLERFEIMERRLYYFIMWPAALCTTLFGLVLLLSSPIYYLKAGWMHAKLTCVALLWIYHLMCGHYRRTFIELSDVRTSRFYRFWNEIPTLLLVIIVILVVVKGF